MEQPGGEIRRVVCFPPDGKLDTVAKILHVGEKGGVYYVNEKGKRIYLKKYQYKQLLEQHQLNGAVNIGTLDFDSISPYKTRNGAAGTTQQALTGNAGQPVGGPAPATRGRGRPRGSINRGRGGGSTAGTPPARSPMQQQQQSPQYSPAPMTPGDDNLQDYMSDAAIAQVVDEINAMINSGEFMWDGTNALVRNPNYAGPMTPTVSASASSQSARTTPQPSPYVNGAPVGNVQSSPFWSGSLANTPQQSPLYFSQSGATSQQSSSSYIVNDTGSLATRGRGRGTRGRGRGSAPPSPAPAFTPQQQQQWAPPIWPNLARPVEERYILLDPHNR